MSRTAPSLPAPFLTGHLKRLREDVLGLMTEATAKCGDVVRYRVGPLVLHQVNHPDHVAHVLKTNRENYDKQSRSSANLRLICGESLLTANGPTWRRKRRMIQPMFHHRAVEGFVSTIATSTAAMLDEWQVKNARGESVEISSEMMKLTFRIVGKCLFGEELEREALAVEKSMHVLVSHTFKRWKSILNPPSGWPTPGNMRFLAALADIDEIVSRLIAGHRAVRPDAPDLLTMLMDGKDAETGAPVPDGEIRNEAVTFLLAGHETTANALAWSLHLLCQHPGYADEIASQFTNVCGESFPTMSDLPLLTNALHLFEESNRLFPPIWAMERRVIAEDEIAGFRIPPGSGMIISPYTLHRHPDFWETPEKFLPERFEKRDHPAYLPFGAGQRVCIGSEFALAEARVILPMILRRFRITAVPGQAIVPEPAITLRMGSGLRVRLSLR